MAIDFDNLDPETREAFERLRSVNMSMGAYLKIVEGALCSPPGRPAKGRAKRSWPRDDADLTDDERKTRTAWELGSRNRAEGAQRTVTRRVRSKE